MAISSQDIFTQLFYSFMPANVPLINGSFRVTAAGFMGFKYESIKTLFNNITKLKGSTCFYITFILSILLVLKLCFSLVILLGFKHWYLALFYYRLLQNLFSSKIRLRVQQKSFQPQLQAIAYFLFFPPASVELKQLYCFKRIKF